MSNESTVFDWDLQKFTTSVAAMDKEHEGLVQLMNQLYQLNLKSAPKDQLLRVASQLGQKTKEHFVHEEKYLEGLKGYQGLATHKIIHARLLENFQKHVDSFHESSAMTLPKEFFDFLKVWLSAHICGVDKKYGEVSKVA